MILDYFVKTSLIETVFIDKNDEKHIVKGLLSYPSDQEEFAHSNETISEFVADMLADYCDEQQVMSKEIFMISRSDYPTSIASFLKVIKDECLNTLEFTASSFKNEINDH